MKKIRAAVVGYGNIGHYSVQALEAATDFEIAGIVRRNGAENKPAELAEYEVVKDITELKDVDVAILATPSRSCEEYAKKILALGINTVDSFDIHTGIVDYRATLMPICKEHNAVAVISAGWDPGSDSIVRTLMQSLAPKGLSYTNFGPGMSMGHSVCVRSKAGVKNALSVTIPKGEGLHRRMVYVELEEGAKLEDVAKAVKEDPYFANDETHVFAVDSVDEVRDMGHGVNLVRKGVSGKTQNQRMEFNMSINNPALTGQVLVNVARASVRQPPTTSESRNPRSASSQLSPILSVLVKGISTYFFFPAPDNPASTCSVYVFPILPMNQFPPHSARSATGRNFIGYNFFFFCSIINFIEPTNIGINRDFLRIFADYGIDNFY